MKILPCALLLVVCLALPAAGAEEDESGAEGAGGPAELGTDAPEIPEKKRKAIRELMDLTGAADYGEQLSQNLMSQLRPAFPDVPESRWPEIAESLDTTEVTRQVVAVYDRHFELAELQAMIDFYSTPVGQDVLRKLPRVMQESMQAYQSWGHSTTREIVEDLAEDGFEPVRR